VRGRWGEIQLRNVVEMSGMIEYCDFYEQPTVQTEDSFQRPDMIIRLPNHRQIAIDAKTPLAAYLEAFESEDEDRRQEHLERHARHIREHLQKLGQKQYWKNLDHTPDFVLMFLPGESFFSAALQADPQLIEFGVSQKVIITTPTTLIALLKTIEWGWKEERMAQNAQEIKDLGQRLFHSVCVFSNHLVNMGKGLRKTTKSYNDAVGSLQRNVLKTAEKLGALGVANDNIIPELPPIEDAIRELDDSDDLIPDQLSQKIS